MSTNTKLYHQIELAFWDWFINELSESKTVRRLIAISYRLMIDKRYTQARIAFWVTGMGGMCFGILAAWLVTSLR
jgi:hypothetical protein